MSQTIIYDDHDRPCTELRLLPLGAGSNLLVGKQSYDQEIAFRIERNKELGSAFQFSLPTWESLEVYASTK